MLGLHRNSACMSLKEAQVSSIHMRVFGLFPDDPYLDLNKQNKTSCGYYKPSAPHQ